MTTALECKLGIAAGVFVCAVAGSLFFLPLAAQIMAIPTFGAIGWGLIHFNLEALKDVRAGKDPYGFCADDQEDEECP